MGFPFKSDFITSAEEIRQADAAIGTGIHLFMYTMYNSVSRVHHGIRSGHNVTRTICSIVGYSGR